MATALAFHNQYKIANAEVSEDRLVAKDSDRFPAVRPKADPVKSSEGDTYTIYQLKDDDDNHYRRFISLERLASQGEKSEVKNYNKVYSGAFSGSDSLDKLYHKFNTQHPADFKGHSLSMSDVIVLRQNGVDTAYYVDRFGFAKCPDFIVVAEKTENKVAGEYVLATYNNWSGGTGWHRWETVTDKFDFCCTLLDKTNLVETRYTRAELDNFLKAHPTLEMPGIKHDNGVLKQIYAYRNAACVIAGDYALITEAVTDRGEFAKCRLYKKGFGLIHRFETPHYTHFGWGFKMSTKGTDINITATVEKYGKGSDEAYTYLFKDTGGKALTVVKAPTQQEVDSGKVEVYSCSSCDEIVPVDECDGYGRCAKCQEEYGEID